MYIPNSFITIYLKVALEIAALVEMYKYKENSKTYVKRQILTKIYPFRTLSLDLHKVKRLKIYKK